MTNNNENVAKEGKHPRTKALINKNIEKKLIEARVKELNAKAEAVIKKLHSAQDVCEGIEAELEALYMEYEDVLEG
jgi:gamma-glutamylcysteine synthetase